uniref:Uncharacterized protein n=1 Tax=Lygus hesperus TaxID=30085 RepID=A0A0A9WI38_LYGHE
MGLFSLKGFLYLWTLQVGVAAYCAWGLGLMSIAILVNFSSLLTSFAFAEDADDDTFAEIGVSYAVFFVFVTLGFVTYISAWAGAYQENTGPMKVAVAALLVQLALWIFFTVFCNFRQMTGEL